MKILILVSTLLFTALTAYQCYCDRIAVNLMKELKGGKKCVK